METAKKRNQNLPNSTPRAIRFEMVLVPLHLAFLIFLSSNTIGSESSRKGNSADFSNNKLSQEQYQELFTRYKEALHPRASPMLQPVFSKNDHVIRLKSFADAVDEIEHMRLDLGIKTVGVNEIAFMTSEEKKQLVGFVPLNPQEEKTLRQTLRHLNSANSTSSQNPVSGSSQMSVDWRPYLSDVKQQYSCGGCWSFAATGLIESLFAIKNGYVISLSEQQFLDCDREINQGCAGGNYYNAFKDYSYKKPGITPEKVYPYEAISTNPCATNLASEGILYSSSEVLFIERTEEAMIAALQKSPVAVAISAYNPTFQYYTGGIIEDAQGCGTQVDHAVLLVGYGQAEDGTPFWLIKNSWGSSFGENGFVRIRRGLLDQTNGLGVCGILSQGNTLMEVQCLNDTLCQSYQSKLFCTTFDGCVMSTFSNSSVPPDFVDTFFSLSNGLLSNPIFIASLFGSISLCMLIFVSWYFLRRYRRLNKKASATIFEKENLACLKQEFPEFSDDVLTLIFQEQAQGDVNLAKKLLTELSAENEFTPF